jgi:hypothetical protein
MNDNNAAPAAQPIQDIRGLAALVDPNEPTTDPEPVKAPARPNLYQLKKLAESCTEHYESLTHLANSITSDGSQCALEPGPLEVEYEKLTTGLINSAWALLQFDTEFHTQFDGKIITAIASKGGKDATIPSVLASLHKNKQILRKRLEDIMNNHSDNQE